MELKQTGSFKNIYFYLFTWLRWVSVAARGTFDLCCSMWEPLGTA